MHVRSMHAPPCVYANMLSWHGVHISVYTFKHMPCHPYKIATDHEADHGRGLLCDLHAYQVARLGSGSIP